MTISNKRKRSIMTRYQLWSRDEYGQGSIINSSEDLDAMIEQGKKEVDNLNVNNALTIDDKKRNWEAYFVELQDVKKASNKLDETKMVFGGKNNHGKDTAFNRETNEIVLLKQGKVEGQQVKVYLGNLDRKDWYAEDPRRNPIETSDHELLRDKTVFFIKKV